MPLSPQRVYVDVLIGLPLKQQSFTYVIEEDRDATLMYKLVYVPFGKRHTSGLIIGVSYQNPDTSIRYKKVIRVLDYPALPSHIWSLWQWVSRYYMCSLGEVFNAAVPSAFRPESDDDTYTIPIQKGWLPSSRLHDDTAYRDALYTELSRSPACLRVLERIINDPVESSKEVTMTPMSMNELSQYYGVSDGVIRKLREQGIFEEVEIKQDDYVRNHPIVISDHISSHLSPLIGKREKERQMILVHLSGRSESEMIPYEQIQEELNNGGQVLLLLPTSEVLHQVENHLMESFGELCHFYYSNSRPTSRNRSWLAALSGESGVYVGLRAAVWLPFKSLSLVVVCDESHRGFRQYEPAPRFTAGHVSMMLARLQKAPVILVASDPSVESHLLAHKGAYHYIAVPAVKDSEHKVVTEAISLEEGFKKNKVRGRLLTFEMIDAIKMALSEGGRALLYYHRRGFARQLVCPSCGHTPQCPHCRVAYRYYRQNDRVVCPICGHYEGVSDVCPSCHSDELRAEGTGIERLHEELMGLFPEALISTADDPKANAQVILSGDYEPNLEQLIGVTTIGLIQLDHMATAPDFRANERTYQFLQRLRLNAPQLKRMIIQALNIEINAIKAFMRNDYSMMFDHELEERSIIGYPPFTRMIDLYIESSNRSDAFSLGQMIVEHLSHEHEEITVLGPAPMPVHKKEVDVGYKLTIFHSRTLSTDDFHHYLIDLVDRIQKNSDTKNCFTYFDVDPL